MPFQVIWEDPEQTIIRQLYTGKVTTGDYYRAVDRNAEMMHSVNHPVDLIVDVLDARTDMKGFWAAISYANKKVPDNQRLVIVVGADSFLKVLSGVANKVAPRAASNSYFVDSLDEAYRIIADNRSSVIDAD